MSHSPSTSPVRNAGNSGGKSSKITDGCMVNARSRRLIHKFGGPEETVREKRVRKAVTKRPRPKGPGGRTLQQRGSDFEFDSVYTDESPSRTATEHHEDNMSDLKFDTSHFSPPSTSPPHSPIPQLPSGSPPPSDNSETFNRQRPLRYNAQGSGPIDRKPRISHRQQPYLGYFAHHDPRHYQQGSIPGEQFRVNEHLHPQIQMITSSHLSTQYFGGHPQIHVSPTLCAQQFFDSPGGQSGGKCTPSHQKDISPNSSTAQNIPKKLYMRGGQGHALSLEAKRAQRKQQDVRSPTAVNGATSSGGDTFQYEIDLETLKRLQLHSHKSEMCKPEVSTEGDGSHCESCDEEESMLESDPDLDDETITLTFDESCRQQTSTRANLRASPYS